MRKTLLLLTLLIILPSALSKPRPLKLIESPWALRELYFINGSLFWRHEIKADYTRIPFGNIILWYPVYGKPGAQINITVEYSWNGVEEYLGEPASIYLILIGFSDTYRNNWFSDSSRKYFGQILANETNFKKTFKVKLPQSSGILVLVVELYRKHLSLENLISRMYVFSVIVNYSKETGFYEENYNKALNEVKYYEKLLYQNRQYKSIFESLLNESSALKKEIEILENKIVELNNTRRSLLEKLDTLNKINVYLRNNLSEVEKEYKKLYSKKDNIVKEINSYKLKTAIFLLASLLLIAGSIKYRRRKLAILVILLLPQLTFPQPNSFITVTSAVWKLEVTTKLNKNIHVLCKAVFLDNENISLSGIDYLFRVDKTGLGWVGEFSYICLTREKYYVEGLFLKSENYDSRIPFEEECSYLLKIDFNLSSVQSFEEYSVIVLIYSFKGDLFHSFIKLFNFSDVFCIRCLRSKNILFSSQISYVNETIKKLRKIVSKLNNTVTLLEADVANINESIGKVLNENEYLEKRINYLENEIYELKVGLPKLEEEKVFYFNAYIASVCLFMVIVVVEAVLFFRKRIKVFVFL